MVPNPYEYRGHTMIIFNYIFEKNIFPDSVIGVDG